MTVVQAREADQPMLIIGNSLRNEIVLYRLNQSGKLTKTGSRQSSGRLRSLVPVHNGSPSRLAMFSPDHGSIEIAPPGESGESYSLNVPPDVDNMAIEEVTNDGRPDLLLFGKRAAGLNVYRGSAKGFSATGISLLPELSISDAITNDLNGDRIHDLFVSDWLSNRIVLYLGIGRGVFSEQVSVALSGEPADLALHRDGQKRLRIAVTLPDLKQVQVFGVNALGEFTAEAILLCPGVPKGVHFSDVNADGTIDLITSTEGELVVFSGMGSRRFSTPSLFAAGGTVIDWCVVDLDGDNLDDAAILTTRPSKVVLLGNASFSGRIDWPPTYSVGRSPRGLTAGDFNDDGMLDIGVVSSTPGSLSFLLNRGEGRMTGPFFSSVAANPVSVKAVTGPNGNPGATFVISHSPSTQVTVVRSGEGLSSFVIPTAPNPFVLSAALDPSSGKLSFLASNRGDDRSGVSISLFKEVSEDKFIETSLRPNPERRVTSITSFDMTGDGMPDLVFSTFEKSRNESTVSVSRGMDRFTFAPHQRLYSFQDSVGAIRFIQGVLVDHDGQTDIMAVLGEPAPSLLLLYGNQEGGIRDSVHWIRGVDVPTEDALIIQDLDNDGNTDLCFVDSGSKSVVAVYGDGTGHFRDRKPILPSEGVVAIVAGPFRSPPFNDLVISNESEGTVTLISNPF